MTTLLKREYTYNNVVWDSLFGRIKTIIQEEYNYTPYVASNLDLSIQSPFRVWMTSQETDDIFTNAWHKRYVFSVNYYLKTEHSEGFYKKLYQESERIYQLLFNNQGTRSLSTICYFNGEPEGIELSQEGNYFRIEVQYSCRVFRNSDAIYLDTSPSLVSAPTRAINPVFNFWSLQFDGTDDIINTGLEGLSSGSSFTFSAWINGVTFASTDKTIISNGQLGNHRLFSVEASKLYLQIFYGTDYTNDVIRARGTTTLSLNTWYHVVAIYNGTSIKLYVNGVEETTTDDDGKGSTGNVSNTTTIGYLLRDTQESFFSGNMMDVAMWNTVLSESVISTIYNNGDPILLTENQGAYKSSGDLVAYYRMGSGSDDDRVTDGLIADQVDSSIGTELFDSDATSNISHWVSGGNDGIEVEDGAIKITNDSNSYIRLRNSVALSEDLVEGNAYKLQADIKVASGTSMTWYLTVGDIPNASNLFLKRDTSNPTAFTTYYMYFIADASAAGSIGDAYLKTSSMGSGEITYITNLSLKKVSGKPGVMLNFDSLDFRTNIPQIYEKALFFNSLVFDGTDDYIQIETDPLAGESEGSISWWSKTSVDDMADQAVVGYHRDQWSIRQDVDQVYFGINTRADAEVYSNTVTDDTGWCHFVVTFNAGAIAFYRNGTSIGTGDTTEESTGGARDETTAFPSNTNGIFIGKRKHENNYAYGGNIADVALYSAALNQDNITAMYNSGKPIDLTSDSGDYNNANNMVGYWKMGDGYLDEIPNTICEGGILDQVTPVLDVKEYVNFATPPSGQGYPTFDFSNGLDGWVQSHIPVGEGGGGFGAIAFVEAEGESLTVSGGQVTMIANGSLSYIALTAVVPDGASVYRLEIDIESLTIGTEGWGYSGGGVPTYVGRVNITTIGKHIEYFQFNPGTGAALELRIHAGGAYTAEEQASFGLNTVVVNSVSVKKVNGNIGRCFSMDEDNQSTDVPS